jgi:hypothetical protein
MIIKSYVPTAVKYLVTTTEIVILSDSEEPEACGTGTTTTLPVLLQGGLFLFVISSVSENHVVLSEAKSRWNALLRDLASPS